MFAICAVMFSLSFAQEPKEMPPLVKRYIEFSDEKRQAKIADVEQDIKDRIASAAKRRNATQAQKKQQGAEITALKKELDSLKKNDPPFVPTINPSNFQVGQMGSMVLDSGTSGFANILPDGRQVSSPGTTATKLRVFQIENKNQMTLQPYFTNGKIDFAKDLFIVKGIDTTRFATGQTISLDGVFRVSGTHSFDTLGGNLTMFVIEPINVAPWIKSDR